MARSLHPRRGARTARDERREVTCFSQISSRAACPISFFLQEVVIMEGDQGGTLKRVQPGTAGTTEEN